MKFIVRGIKGREKEVTTHVDVDVGSVVRNVKPKGNQPVVGEGELLRLQMEVHGAGHVVEILGGGLPGVLCRHGGGNGHGLTSSRRHRKSVWLGHLQLWTITRTGKLLRGILWASVIIIIIIIIIIKYISTVLNPPESNLHEAQSGVHVQLNLSKLIIQLKPGK